MIDCACNWVDKEKKQLEMCGAHVQAARDFMAGTVQKLTEEAERLNKLKQLYEKKARSGDFHQALTEIQWEMIDLLSDRVKELS